MFAVSAAAADTLDAPAEVTAQLDGSFSFEVTFHKGPGSSQLAGYSWHGESNIQGGLFADCFCESFCPMFDPGDTFTWQVSGQLTDPGAPGSVTENFALCTSGGASATTLVHNYSVTGVGLPALAGARLWIEPNPFSGRTTFHYDLPVTGAISLGVYDLTGRRVAQIVEGVQPSGRHEAVWNARTGLGAGPARGVLFARLAFAGRVRTVPLIFVR